ncbi:hypothetical protein G9U51_14500 [Calidifontibacter sp. DB0510]|uniref:Oxalate:formate antiporter n=1 Tax=Metallococcus carri TaxID=1656884 RepID=A0A967B2W0_9MICO|nr:hypothetical protein [Metallococcus carri]NHN56979.1 hypothetical protein [Metallococcus carri]NOP37724.1 hypothetical protein [Calidifontibacter sp. DB2511S]
MTERNPDPVTAPSTTSPALIALAWIVVAIPLLYGLWQAILKAAKLFTG